MLTEDAPERLRAQPAWLLAQASRRVTRTVADRLAGVGAHRTHHAALAALAETSPCSQASLARRCGVDRSDMVALVERLTEDGHVAREPDPDDRRRYRLSLTPAGERRLRELDAVVAAAQGDALHPLSAAERDWLAHLLTTVVHGSRR